MENNISILSKFIGKLSTESKLTFASVSVDGTSVPLYEGVLNWSLSGDAEVCSVAHSHHGVELHLDITKHSAYDAIEWLLSIKNCSNTRSGTISNINSLDLCIPLCGSDKIIWKGISGDINGAQSFLPFEKEICEGIHETVIPYGGKSSDHEFPFFDLCDNVGGVICAVGWSGRWQYTLERSETSIRVTAGLPFAEFYLEPGESVRLPRILLKHYSGSNTDAHNIFRRLIRNHYSPQTYMGQDFVLPIALQNFDRYHEETPSWNTEEAQKKSVDFAMRCQNTDTYWLDASWFKGGFPNGVGNYSYREGFPNGMRPVSDYAHSNGLRVLIWFEPERVAPDTELMRQHPEWILSTDDNKITSLLFDFSNQDAADWITKKIGDLIEEMEIDIYRHDFNVYPLSFWEKKDEAGRRGVTEIRYIENLYRFWDSLIQRFPKLVVDNCASGGNRMDFEAGIRSVFLWRSDTGCRPLCGEDDSDVCNQNQTMALSPYVVNHAIATWSMAANDCRSALTCGLAANFDVFNPEFDFDTARTVLSECRRLQKYWAGDFYVLFPINLDYSCWTGYQLHLPDENSGMFMLFRRTQSNEPEKTVCIHALDKNSKYNLTLIGEDYSVSECEASGSELMRGYKFKIPCARQSLLVEYVRLQ